MMAAVLQKEEHHLLVFTNYTQVLNGSRDHFQREFPDRIIKQFSLIMVNYAGQIRTQLRISSQCMLLVVTGKYAVHGNIMLHQQEARVVGWPGPLLVQSSIFCLHLSAGISGNRYSRVLQLPTLV